MSGSASIEDTVETQLPDPARLLREPSGCIEHDDLGNAIWNWSERGLATAENYVPAVLRIIDDPRDEDLEGTRVETLKARQPGGGYNPYSAGPRVRKPATPQRDLRALSRSIEEARRARAAADGVARERDA